MDTGEFPHVGERLIVLLLVAPCLSPFKSESPTACGILERRKEEEDRCIGENSVDFGLEPLKSSPQFCRSPLRSANVTIITWHSEPHATSGRKNATNGGSRQQIKPNSYGHRQSAPKADLACSRHKVEKKARCSPGRWDRRLTRATSRKIW